MREYYAPPMLFEGQTAFVLGSGPSLTARDVERLRHRNVIAVNTAATVAPSAPVLFFNDSGWFAKHRHLVGAWSGLALTTARSVLRDAPNVRCVLFENRPDFPQPGCGVFKVGRSSGHRAVSLAIGMGAMRVALLGFDMREVNGRSHFHDEYRCRDPKLYALSFIPGFDGWDAAARKVGVDIVNCTHGSPLTELRISDLEEVLT